MKKRELSDAELQRVIAHRQKGFSWLRIQKETAIPRHIAKRSYEQWQSTKSTEELKEARKEVAAEEFRKHLEALVSLSQSIIDSLRIPAPMETDASRETSQPWMNNVLKDGLDTPTRLLSKHKERLFKSLQEHTQEKVPWHSLEDWKQVKRDFDNNFRALRGKAKEILDNILSQEEYIDLKFNIANELKESISVEILADGVAKVILQGILTHKPDQIHVFEGTSLISKGIVELKFYSDTTGLRIDDLALAKKILSLCKWAINNLRCGDRTGLIEAISKNIKTMRKKYDDLEDLLNELTLRPIILQTRCKLCPA